jgi:hypothetical protein
VAALLARAAAIEVGLSSVWFDLALHLLDPGATPDTSLVHVHRGLERVREGRGFVRDALAQLSRRDAPGTAAERALAELEATSLDLLLEFNGGKFAMTRERVLRVKALRGDGYLMLPEFVRELGSLPHPANLLPPVQRHLDDVLHFLRRASRGADGAAREAPAVLSGLESIARVLSASAWTGASRARFEEASERLLAGLSELPRPHGALVGAIARDLWEAYRVPGGVRRRELLQRAHRNRAVLEARLSPGPRET